MNRYEFLKKTYPLRLLFGGMRRRETKFYIFTSPLDLESICSKLWRYGWGTNLLSTTFRGEAWTLYKPAGDNQHQYHLRLYRAYRGIEFEGHYEADAQLFPAEHKDGVDIRVFTTQEVKDLWRLL